MNKSKLKTARVAHGWTQAELAAHSGVSRPTIAALEQGRATGSTRTLIKLADALGVSVKSLFFSKKA